MSETNRDGGAPRAVLAHPVDHSVKMLVTQSPNIFLRLTGTMIGSECLHRDNTAINIAGMAADYVHVVEEPGQESWVLYQEFALRPDPADLGDWELKKAALRKIHQKKVLLLIVYLEKGDYATFPDRLTETAGGLTNQFSVDTVCLWHYKELIASGQDPHLLPLRLLAEENPTPQMLEEIRDSIWRSPLPILEQRELLSVAVILGSRRFTREVVMAVLGEVGIPVKDLPVIGEWITEAEDKARNEGEAAGEAAGEARGEAAGERQMALIVLSEQFGDLPHSVIETVNGADKEWCENIVRRALKGSSLQDLGLE